MAIAFSNPLPDDFYNRVHNSCNFDEKTDFCAVNIHEFLSIIKIFHGFCKCSLERCQVRLFFEGLESYSSSLRRSDSFVTNNFIDLCQKYPVGVKDCVSIIENRPFIMLPRPHNHSK